MGMLAPVPTHEPTCAPIPPFWNLLIMPGRPPFCWSICNAACIIEPWLCWAPAPSTFCSNPSSNPIRSPALFYAKPGFYATTVATRCNGAALEMPGESRGVIGEYPEVVRRKLDERVTAAGEDIAVAAKAQRA